jgi:hypothetical protein
MDIVTVAGILRGTMVVMAGTARGTIPGMHHGMIHGMIRGTILATMAIILHGATVGTAAITIVLGDTMDGADLIRDTMVVAATMCRVPSPQASTITTVVTIIMMVRDV